MNRQKSEANCGYEIRIKGHLNPRRLSWFEAVTVVPLPEGITLLTIREKDQASLHALLKALNDLGVTLVSVIPVSESREPYHD